MIILLVEDNPITVQSVADRLREAGHTVATSREGMEAKALLRRGLKPDVILLDLMMPGMDGKRFLSEMYGSDPATRPQCPVVLFTAATDGDLASIRRAGVRIVQKPVEMPTLETVLSEVVANAAQ